jgi:hypothetical protein
MTPTDTDNKEIEKIQSESKIVFSGINQTSERLWLPFYGRYLEMQREDALLSDPKSVDWLQRLDIDLETELTSYAHRRTSLLGCILRLSTWALGYVPGFGGSIMVNSTGMTLIVLTS